MGFLFSALEILGPTIVGIVTVPIFGAIKKAVSPIDKLPAWAKQIGVAAVAGVLSFVGSQLQVVLPGDLTVFGQTEVSTLLSAAMAYGIHAGRKRLGG